MQSCFVSALDASSARSQCPYSISSSTDNTLLFLSIPYGKKTQISTESCTVLESFGILFPNIMSINKSHLSSVSSFFSTDYNIFIKRNKILVNFNRPDSQLEHYLKKRCTVFANNVIGKAIGIHRCQHEKTHIL